MTVKALPQPWCWGRSLLDVVSAGPVTVCLLCCCSSPATCQPRCGHSQGKGECGIFQYFCSTLHLQNLHKGGAGGKHQCPCLCSACPICARLVAHSRLPPYSDCWLTLFAMTAGFVDTHLAQGWLTGTDVVPAAVQRVVRPAVKRILPWILVPPSRAVQTMLYAASAPAAEVRPAVHEMQAACFCLQGLQVCAVSPLIIPARSERHVYLNAERMEL